MKPIETRIVREKKESRRKRNHTIIGLFIAALMIFSILGYAILSGQRATEIEEQKEYNNHIFTETDQGWQTQINAGNKIITLTTSYFPKELENITTQGKFFFSDFNAKTIYIITNASTEKAASKLAFSLNNIALRIQAACSENESETDYCLDKNLPVKTCSDVSFQTKIIELKLKETGNETETEPKIIYENSCLIIQGKSQELITASEKAIFMIFEIM